MPFNIYDLAREIQNDPKERAMLASIAVKHLAEITAETRQKQSQAKREHWKRPEYREKITRALTGRIRTDISKALKAAHADPVIHARLTAAFRRPEHRKAVAERMKALWADPVWSAKLKAKRRAVRLAKSVR